MCKVTLIRQVDLIVAAIPHMSPSSVAKITLLGIIADRAHGEISAVTTHFDSYVHDMSTVSAGGSSELLSNII